MDVNVTCRHIDVTDALREHAFDKVEHALSSFPRIMDVHVILDVEKYRHKAEIVAHAKNHITVEAEHESDDMYVSIDHAVDKAAKQLRRLRDKVQDHKAKDKLSKVHMDLQREAEPD